MSGKRHHFIPRFLLNGFASHSKGDQIYTWVYRKDSHPFNTNVINVGVEGNFYSAKDGAEVDEEVTIAEVEFSELIYNLRSGKLDPKKNSKSIAGLIAHLEVRTRHVRQNLLNVGSALFDELQRFCEDELAFNNYLVKKIEKDPSLLKGPIIREFKKNNIPLSHLPEFMHRSKPLLRKMLPKALPEIRQAVSLVIERVSSEMEEISKRGHIQALTKGIAPKKISKIFSKFKFQLYEYEIGSLPLGDSIVIFHVEGDRPFKSFFEKGDRLIGIYLPLTPGSFMFGSKNNSEPISSDLPMAIATCSLEYFVSSTNSHLNDPLQSQIGVAADILSKRQVESLIDEFWND